MKYGLTAVMASAVIAAALAGCSGDDAIDPSANTGEAINRSVLLDNLDDVRAMIADNADSLDPAVVENVDYSEGRLHVWLAASQNGLDTSGVEAACNEISESIALPDMMVVVEKADGSESATCEFNG